MLNGQLLPPGATEPAPSTPPPVRFVVDASNTRGSAISALTSSTAAAAVAIASTPRRSPRKHSKTPNYSWPSPKKARANLNRRKSDNDSVCSGNGSDGWEEEEDRVMLQIAALSVEQDALEDAAEAAEGIFPELNEFIVLADEQIGGGEIMKMMFLPCRPLCSNGFKWTTIKKAPRQNTLAR
jgi:hypothetical protein